MSLMHILRYTDRCANVELSLMRNKESGRRLIMLSVLQKRLKQRIESDKQFAGLQLSVTVKLRRSVMIIFSEQVSRIGQLSYGRSN